MVQLYNEKSGKLIGNISEQQLQFLIDQLEEESVEDKDYAITSLTLDYFEEIGAEAELLSILREELGTLDEITILWKQG